MLPRPTLPCSPTLFLLMALCTQSGWAAEEPLPFPDMAPRIGKFLESNYYDPSRFHPRLMVERALRNLEQYEVTADTRWTGGKITVVIQGQTTTLTAPEPANLDEAMAQIEAVRKVIDGTTLVDTRKRELAYALVNGALASLDPHTVLFAPEPAKSFSEDIAGEFFGIGAYLTQEDGVVAIERVMAGFPAERAGVEDGDIIVGIDGERTAGLSLDQAVKRIKGPKGTTVNLTLERCKQGQTLDLAIVRDLVQVTTMRAWRPPGEKSGVGYVRMDEFNANTARDLKAAIDALKAQGPLTAFILDLRFNGGGLLDQAKVIGNFFLPRGKEIVRTVTIDGDPEIFTTSARNMLLDIPMVVLTAGSSASAAEILSGALQRNDRAVVLGTTTFGKGSVQTVRPLMDGSRLKLTIQEYQLPGGVSIQDVGVNPDIRLVRRSLHKDGTLDLLPYSSSREEDEEFALGNRKAYQHTTAGELGWLAVWKSKEEIKGSNLSARDYTPDQEGLLAVDLLTAATARPGFAEGAADALKAGKSRQWLLEQLKAPVAERREKEAQVLGAALAKLAKPITWGPATPAIPDNSLQVAYTGPAEVTAGTSAELTFKITNSGPAPVGRVYGLMEADRFSPLWESEVIVGLVAAAGATEASLRFRVPPRMFAGEERFTLLLRVDGIAAPVAKLPVSLRVVAAPRPHLGFTWKLDDPATLKPGEPARLQVSVINDGDGPTAPVTLRVFKADDAFVQLGESRFDAGILAPGATFTAPVSVTIAEQVRTQKFTADKIKLQFGAQETFPEDSLVDPRWRAALVTSITIPVGQPVAGKSIIAPKIDAVATVTGTEAAISVQVKDDNLRFVTVFQDEDKVDLRPATDKTGGSFSFSVTLKPGINNLRVVAADADEVDQVTPLRLWGPGVPTPKKSTPGTPAQQNLIP